MRIIGTQHGKTGINRRPRRSKAYLRVNWDNVDPFYKSEEWRILSYRMRVFNRECVLCKSTYRLQVDHIKPRSKYPELALDPKNLQVLCRKCNLAKGNSGP